MSCLNFPLLHSCYHPLVMKKLFALVLTISFGFTTALAQQADCGTDELHQLFLQNVSNLQKHNQIEQLIYSATQSGNLQPSGRADFVIPVVVHIIHNGGSENISDNQVIQAIDYMNQAFRNTNLYDSTVGVNTGIQFCLAKQNPQGQSTTGILRVQSALTDLNISQDQQMKNLSRWNPNCYMNIWVVKTICSQGSCNIGGYAYFPTAHGSNIDGIVVRASTMGSTPAATGTPIHEVGHYLGLYHTFQGGCTNNNCLTDGDRVCDTPPDASTAYIACNGTMNSCTTDVLSGFTSDQPDMHKNYMDYTQPTCRTIYTAGQRDRMVWHLVNVRGSLLNCSSCLNPCPSPVTAKFTASSTSIAVGASVTFTNSSAGASSYQWFLNGTQFATSVSPSYIFNSAGTFQVKLVATGNNPDCFDDTTITIKVNCGVAAKFNPPTANVAPGVNYSLTNTSTGANNYRWFVNGIQVGTTTNFSYSFPANGVYWVHLIACSNACCDTTDSVRVFVCNPCIEICDNGIDDDGDDLVDCFDPDCVCDNCSPKQTDVWTFGEGAGLNFKTSPPTPFLSSNQRSQASASVADPNGNLVFYTEGFRVYDRFGNVMQNGTGLAGNLSSTQHVIVQHPAIKHQYYLFVTSSYDVGLSGGITYSVIDMSLNFGLGGVTSTKNTLLVSSAQCTEKMTSIRHCNNRFTWLVIKERYNDVYRSYLIDSNGLNTTPVLSTAGSRMQYSGGPEDGAQVIKASADGRLLANPLLNRDTILVMKFNNQTGVITDYLKFGGSHSVGYCGAEFSPSGEFLYATRYGSSTIPYAFFQFDLRSENAQQIYATKFQVDTPVHPYPLCGCQLASDGKIYVAYDKIWPPQNLKTNVPYIEFPDKQGIACSYNKQGIQLVSGSFVYSNLPTFTSNYLLKPVTISGLDTVCSSTLMSSSVLYNITPKQSCISSYVWSAQGGAALVSQSDSAALFSFPTIGDYKVSVHLDNGCSNASDTIDVFAAPCVQPDLGPDTSLCVSSVLTFKAGPGYKSYLWHDGLRDSINTVFGPGKYYVQVVDINGNIFTDTVVVGLDTIRQLSIGNDTTICREQRVDLEVGDKYESYGWTPPIGLSCGNCHNPTATPSATTTYTVTGKSSDGCIGAASITIFVEACLSIGDEQAISVLNVYPVPANDKLNVSINNPEGGTLTVRLYNTIGQVIKSIAHKGNVGNQLLSIPVEDVAKGVYVLELSNQLSRTSVRVAIQ